MTAKQLEDIHNFKQEGDESLYQAWERYNDLLYKCPTHDINNHQKHDETTSRNLESSSSKDGLAALVNKLDNLGRDMKKLKESVYAIQETTRLNKLHGVSFISGPESNTPEVLPHQLPSKELNPGSFTPPCAIDKFNFYAMADLGASINVMPKSIFEHLHLTNLKKTNMLYEMADMSKKAHLGIVENVLLPFMRKNIFGKNEDRISFDTMRKDYSYTNLSEKNFMVRPQSPGHSDNQIDYEELASSQESNKPRPRDYTFREWTLIKVGHTDISEPVKKALLKLWLIDCFQDNSAFVNIPTHRSFDDYKWEFNLEIDKLADEYELGIRKKGYILDNIWEYCNQVHNKNNKWHNYEFENKEYEEIGIEDKDYHPPEVQVETFEVKKYSFEGGQSFICVTKDLDNTLPLGRKNGSKFKEMIRKEVENNKT
ncbi:BYPASS-related protein [Tanacetum coccineum]